MRRMVASCSRSLGAHIRDTDTRSSEAAPISQCVPGASVPLGPPHFRQVPSQSNMDTFPPTNLTPSSGPFSHRNQRSTAKFQRAFMALGSRAGVIQTCARRTTRQRAAELAESDFVDATAARRHPDDCHTNATRSRGDRVAFVWQSCVCHAASGGPATSCNKVSIELSGFQDLGCMNLDPGA